MMQARGRLERNIGGSTRSDKSDDLGRARKRVGRHAAGADLGTLAVFGKRRNKLDKIFLAGVRLACATILLN